VRWMLPRTFDGPISLWLKYIGRPPTTDPPMPVRGEGRCASSGRASSMRA
jgi:hypothetical protein